MVQIGDKSWDARMLLVARLAVVIAVVLNDYWCCCCLVSSLALPIILILPSIHHCRLADHCRYLNCRHLRHRCQQAMAVENLYSKSYIHDDMTLDVFHLASHVVVVDVEALGRYHVDGTTVAGSLAHFGEPAEDWAAGLVIVVAELGFQCSSVS